MLRGYLEPYEIQDFRVTLYIDEAIINGGPVVGKPNNVTLKKIEERLEKLASSDSSLLRDKIN